MKKNIIDALFPAVSLGNNGDFNMDDPDIFAYINNNNNDKSSFWT